MTSESARQRAKALNMEGLELATRKQDVRGALARFLEAQAADPESFDAVNNAGNCLLALDDLDGARQQYERAAALDASRYIVRWNMALIMLRQRQYSASLGFVEQFLQAAATGSDRQANSIVPNAQRLRLLIHTLTAFNAAEEEAQTQLPARTGDPEAQALVVRARQTNNASESLALLAQALERDPGSPEARNLHGVLLMAQRDYPGAIRDFTLGIALAPDQFAFYANRSAVFFMLNPAFMGRAYSDVIELALDDAHQSVALHPNDANLLVHRGKLYRALDELDLAQADIDAALALQPELTDGLYVRGILHNARRDFASAIADYSAALDRAPGRSDILPARALAYAAMGRLQPAIADFERYIAAGCRGEMSAQQAQAVLQALKKQTGTA